MGPPKHKGPTKPREGNNEAKGTRRWGEFSLMSTRRCMRSQRVKPCSKSLAPSSSHVGRAELALSISPELMETDPIGHHISLLMRSKLSFV